MKIFETKRSFRKEFKRQVRLAILAAIGFTIAFSWRETILNAMQNTSINLASSLNLGYSQIFMPLLTSFVGVLIIIITSKLLKE